MGPNPNKVNGRHDHNQNQNGQWNPITTTNGGDKLSSVYLDTGSDTEVISSYSKFWKLPSFKNPRNVFHNAVDFMNGRRQDEGIGRGRWRVHDKLYDLGPFAHRHPGGEEWITMTEGTDITEAFEAAHVLNQGAVRRTLDKYYVGDALTPRNSPFTFKEDGFYKTLQRRVEPVLRAEGGPSPRWSIVLYQDSLALLYFAMSVLSAYTGSFFLHILTGLACGWTVCCAHNFLHIKDNWRKYYFDLCLLSSYEWRMGHALSHHLYTNTIHDYEALGMGPFMCIEAGKRRNFAQRYLSHVYLYILYTQYFGSELVKRVINILYRRVQPLRPENLIPLGGLLINLYFTQSLWYAILNTFVQQSVASLWLTVVGAATAAHHHPDSFHEGDIARRETDFGLCQLDVVKESTEEYNHNATVAITTFGEHPLHHLFPTVCHSKLHALQPTVDSVLEEFGEQIKALNSFQKYTGIHKQLNKQTITDFNKKRDN